MPKVCLETTFLIDYLRGKEEAIQKFQHFVQTGVQLFTTVISLYELHVGLLPDRKKERERLRNLEQAIDIRPLTVTSAKEAAVIMKDLLAKGEPIPVNDAYIAAIAREFRAPVITRDLNHFSKVSDLRVETF
ncbi:MAG: PIN domain-containing protein [Candidatus Hodarchaeales archaeon]|jgi:predicted nucleic acid-binding protein